MSPYFKKYVATVSGGNLFIEKVALFCDNPTRYIAKATLGIIVDIDWFVDTRDSLIYPFHQAQYQQVTVGIYGNCPTV